MAKAEIFAGICGFTTVVEATMDGSSCSLIITSDCQAIQHLAQELTEVDPFQEISFRPLVPLTHRMAARYCAHAACPVCVGIIKAVEVEAGLALPADVFVRLSRSTE